jgi:hypothetical protein
MSSFKLTKDPVVAAIIKRANDRSNQGLDDYGGTMADADKHLLEWIDDAQEELWDTIVYLEKIKLVVGRLTGNALKTRKQ